MQQQPDRTVDDEPHGRTPSSRLRDELRPAVLRLARISLIGVLLGVLVGGVLGRLVMLLLAQLNDAATGRISDDGFEMGRFTLSGSANLLLIGGTLGLLGAGCYFVLRGLMVGPRWFRLLSISVGPAAVTATQIVHTDGVDFTLLQPAWLAIALFVALPAVYCVLLSAISEAVIEGERMTSPTWMVLGLVVWLPFAPLLVVLLGGRIAVAGCRRVPSLRSTAEAPVWPWLARSGLTAVFVVAVASLVGDAGDLI